MEAVPSFAHEQLGAPYEAPLQQGSADWALHQPATQVDGKDKGSPDEWLPRDPRITRLTGRHPLNCEPPMEELMGAGFITPPAIHYVRNHGAVPKFKWETHRVDVNGLVDSPLSLTMDMITSLPAVTLPVTLVCAGNRRKEENMIKKSIGFNWGACAVSTSEWTGVRLCDVLKLAGIHDPVAGANYVCFRGPAGELPKGQDGSYGTSLPYHVAMDEKCDVLLAYKQNGRWLTPDHGFPVRMIIPGYIGGRMVKWLSEITVTREESSNHYHYFDNRVLPPHVDEELANKEGHWYNPDFIINELNINSAIARPSHDEVVYLMANQKYVMKGYAYTGGGRKIIRVEISLDGERWVQANIIRYEKPTSGGKHWCWVHWDLEVELFDYMHCKEVLVRAWDSSMNGQPATITWNVMGMMNNCYYRVKLHPFVSPSGQMGLRFQHPAPPQVGALGNAGWREERSDTAAPSSAPPVPVTASSEVVSVEQAATVKVYTMDEVAQHNNEQSAWFVYEGKVYDATPFLDEHPGGADSILLVAGTDATDEFNSIHSKKAKGMLTKYYIGDVGKDVPAANVHAVSMKYANGNVQAVPSLHVASNGQAASHSNGLSNEAHSNGHANGHIGAPIALDARQKLAFALVEKQMLSHNVARLKFALPTPSHRFGLPVGHHVFLYASIGGETVMRAYSPISSDDDLGYFELVIKIYHANVHPRFPDGGKMSQFLGSLNLGDTILVKGPVGHFTYLGCGAYKNNRKLCNAVSLSFIAGGTGITPCYQVIKAVLKDKKDTTQLALLYANQSVDDILLFDELQELAAAHANFKVWYTVDIAPPDSWKYSSGHINEDMVSKHILPAGVDSLCLLCGPPPMIKFACLPNLASVGYHIDQIITF